VPSLRRVSQSSFDVATTAGRAFGRRIAPYLTRRHALVVIVVLLLTSGAALRLVGTNWDDGAHLHPDERYISTVADNIYWPGSLSGYFDVETSRLSPYNTDKGRDYVYGTLPLFATKLVATALGQEGYGTLNLVGRRLAAILDTLTIGLVFLVALMLLDDLGRRRALQGGLLAAALYAFTVTAIQHAHFFTTDLWLVFFGMLTFLLAVRSIRSGVEEQSRRLSPILPLLGASLGLTVACKVSGAVIGLPVFLALLGRSVLIARWAGRVQALVHLAASALIVVASGYVVFRLVSPYTFAHSSWLDVSVNDSFRSALTSQAHATSGEFLSPPSYQWLLSPRLWSPLENMVVWQLGIPLGIGALAGLGTLVVRVVRTALARRGGQLAPDAVASLTVQLMLVSFVATVFFYFGTRFVHSGRYLLPIVPLLPVAAAYGLCVLTQGRPRLWVVTSTVLVATTALYALSFDHIYTEQNTRIAATNWIQLHVPGGSAIANEHWDDPVPIGGHWVEASKGKGESPAGYRGIVVPVFDPDDADKLHKLYDALSVADYYAVTSPRAWNTIGRLPERFPLMARFYDELFARRLGFVPAATFTSYPGLFGIEIDDLHAEEAFWVYDHPPVTIFRRVRPLRWQTFKASLCPEHVEPYCA
jgi:hypothetical protein